MTIIHLVLLAIGTGVDVQAMLGNMLDGLTAHETALKTLAQLVLASACWRHGWLGK